MRRILLLALALLAVSGSSARAATVTGAGLGAATYTAAPGEANRLELSSGGRGEVGATYLSDRGAAISIAPSAPCTAIQAHLVRCTIDILHADLGDGNDSSVGSACGGRCSAPTDVEGGPGDDVLAGASRLDGGPGDDVLVAPDTGGYLLGGEGSDRLIGRAGNDLLTPGPGADRVDGGAGHDTLLPSDRTFPGFFDLETGQSEADPRLNDTLVSVEAVAGGPGVDVLKGTEGPDRLVAARRGSGNAGGDQLFGRGGDDDLEGYLGTPVNLYGGAGDDLLGSFDRRDALSCGPGRDTVALTSGTATGALVPGDCERVTNSARVAFTHGRVARGRLLIEATVDRRSLGPDCRPVLTIARPGGARYARLTFARSGRLVVALDAAGRAAARRHRQLELRFGGRCGLIGAHWRIRP